MDDDRFDAIARTLGEGSSRRAALRLLAGGALGTALGWFGREDVGAQDDAEDDPEVTDAKKRKRRGNKKRCPAGRKCGQKCCKPGLICRGGKCQNPPPPVVTVQPPPPPPNLALGAPCTSSGQCSQSGGPAICAPNPYVDDGPLNCCREGGGACINDRQCCGINFCDDNQVTPGLTCCGFNNDPCTNDLGCCGTLTCQSGSCQ